MVYNHEPVESVIGCPLASEPGAGEGAATGGAPSPKGTLPPEVLRRWRWPSMEGALPLYRRRGRCHRRRSVAGGGRRRRVPSPEGALPLEALHRRRGPSPEGALPLEVLHRRRGLSSERGCREGARSTLERDERKTAGGGRCSIHSPKSVVIYSILVNGPTVGVQLNPSQIHDVFRILVNRHVSWNFL